MLKKGIGHFHAIRIEDLTILVGKYHKSVKVTSYNDVAIASKIGLEIKLTVFLESSVYFL